MLLLTIGSVIMNNAYEHEVWESGNRYYWKTFDVERGSSTSLTTAIEGAMGSGNRDIHTLTGGSLNAAIELFCGSEVCFGNQQVETDQTLISIVLAHSYFVRLNIASLWRLYHDDKNQES